MVEKTYHPYLFKDYEFIENYWGHDIGDSYNFRTDIKNAVQYLAPLKTVFYSKNLIDVSVNTIIYYPVFYTYPLSTEITKVVIVCLGDSITAGHPQFWAKVLTRLSSNWQSKQI